MRVCLIGYIYNTVGLKPMQVHIHNKHGPTDGSFHAEFHGGVPSYVFSLVVVRRPSDNKFLLVQEFANVWTCVHIFVFILLFFWSVSLRMGTIYVINDTYAVHITGGFLVTWRSRGPW